MPIFMCTKCGRIINADYEVCGSPSSDRKVEIAPECCGKPMIEAADD